MTATAIAVLCATTATTAHAASTVKLQHGKLVTVSNGKIVKGYKVYKQKLYYNGQLAKGRVKYGKGISMKLYHHGVLQKGLYVTKNYKRIFKDGYVIKGNYTYRTEKGLDAVFYNGQLTHLIQVDGAHLRDNGKLKKGLYTIKNEYVDDESKDIISHITLYENGKIAKGTQFADYVNERLLFKNGMIPTSMIYQGKVYQNGIRATKNQYVFVDDRLYANDQPFTGQYDEKYYDAGIFKGSQATIDYVSRRTALQKAEADTLPTLVNEQLAHAVKNYDVIVKDLGYIERGYEDDLQGKLQLANDLRDMQKIILASDAPSRNELYAQVERILEQSYAKEGYVYRDGKIITGWYEDNFYELGVFVRTGAEQRVIENRDTFSATMDHLAAITDTAEAKTAIQDIVTQFITLLQHVDTVFDMSKTNASIDTTEAQKIIATSLLTRKELLQQAKRLQVAVDTTALDAQIVTSYEKIGKTVSFEPSNAQATYIPITVGRLVKGTFDKNGYAYLTVDIKEKEGNYAFNGDVANNLIQLSDQQNGSTADEQTANTLTYLKNGQYYIILKGEPNSAYKTTFTKRAYNVDTITNWQPTKNISGNRVKIPLYAQTPTIPFHLSTNEAIRFYVVRSDGDYQRPVVNKLQLTNMTTGAVYEAVVENENYYYANVPNGDYKLSVTPHSQDIGTPKHIAINYQLIPLLIFNKPVTNASTLNVKKEATYQFTLQRRDQEQISDNESVTLYDDKQHIVKNFVLPKGKISKKMTYTISKGRYTIKSNYDILYTVNK